jgi:hypothetical protein
VKKPRFEIKLLKPDNSDIDGRIILVTFCDSNNSYEVWSYPNYNATYASRTGQSVQFTKSEICNYVRTLYVNRFHKELIYRREYKIAFFAYEKFMKMRAFI